MLSVSRNAFKLVWDPHSRGLTEAGIPEFICVEFWSFNHASSPEFEAKHSTFIHFIHMHCHIWKSHPHPKAFHISDHGCVPSLKQYNRGFSIFQRYTSSASCLINMSGSVDPYYGSRLFSKGLKTWYCGYLLIPNRYIQLVPKHRQLSQSAGRAPAEPQLSTRDYLIRLIPKLSSRETSGNTWWLTSRSLMSSNDSTVII